MFSGFAWADSRSTGPAALVWADRDQGAAREAAAGLALRLARGREPGAGATRSGAAETIAWAAAQRRALVLDPADDPCAGGSGDTPALLSALLQAGLPAALGVLADGCALAAARDAGEGGSFEHAFGAGLTRLYGPPVVARARVLRLLPALAVLQAGPVTLLVGDRPEPAVPALFERAGVALAGLRLLAVKGGEAAAAEFAPQFPLAAAADCPGPCSPHFDAQPYHYVPPERRAPGAAERFASDQERAGQAERRHEHRRPHPQQQRPQTLGPQGPQIGVEA